VTDKQTDRQTDRQSEKAGMFGLVFAPVTIGRRAAAATSKISHQTYKVERLRAN
jgi:hypothetical protein